MKVFCHCKIPVWLVALSRLFRDNMDMEGKLMCTKVDQHRAKLGVYDVTTAAKRLIFTEYFVLCQ